jgi:hypothetical protein
MHLCFYQLILLNNSLFFILIYKTIRLCHFVFNTFKNTQIFSVKFIPSDLFPFSLLLSERVKV